jgi:hypothetical protein
MRRPKSSQEDADRVMEELLEEEGKAAAAAAAVSQKKKQAKAGKERRKAANGEHCSSGEHWSQKEDHAEEQKDTERTKAKTEPEKKTPGAALAEEKKEGASKTKIQRKEKAINALKNEDNKDATAKAVGNVQEITRATCSLLQPITASSTCTTAAEEEMREAGARESCVEHAPSLTSAAEAESLFWAKFNLSPSNASSGEPWTAASTAALGPAAAPEEAPAPAQSMTQAGPAAARAVAHFVSDSFPQSFLCPLTMEVMRDPVVTADGQTYERTEIERWFALGNRTSPLTGAELPITLLFPNIALRNTIQDAGA